LTKFFEIYPENTILHSQYFSPTLVPNLYIITKDFFLFFGLIAIIMVSALIAIDDTSEFRLLDTNTEIKDLVANVGERVAHSVRYIDF
jgi:hypothetical protein